VGRILGIVSALLVLVVALLVDGLFFPRHDEDHQKPQEVALLSAEDLEQQKEEKKEEKVAEASEKIETEEEPPPDAAEILQDLDLDALQQQPELEAASLGAITDALNGLTGGGGEFGEALSFSSGGVIGGKGKAGDLDEKTESIFSLADIDQKPRAVFQAAPLFPSTMRGKKLEGVVTLIFVVDSGGRVSDPRVEKSTHPAFERPALEAIRQWKFEPAVKAGQRVPCKMRVPIRFQPS